jgi:tetratricopeptide (TPR) repeat protein
MKPTTFKYNPSFQSDADLIQAFVVRKESLEFVLEVLRENTARPNEPPHHILVVGPRGSGKTMLVRRVAAEIRANPDMYGQWYPVAFSEEPYHISSPGEFWLEAIFHLADQTRDPRWEKTHADLRNEPDDRRLAERCLAQLLDFANGSNKRVLLIAENLNMLLGEQITANAAWELRHTLQNESQFMLLGTATVRFHEIDNIDKAWFELVSVRTLDPLSTQECGTLWEAITEMPIAPRQLRAIEILTGGNPRLIQVLAGFAAKRSFSELMEQLVQLIDDHTDYFKGLLDNLPVRERRVFSALLDAWDPVGARDIAQATRLTPSEVSAWLNRLVARGAVQISEESPRRKSYQAAERLFNIYYLMRHRGHPSNRVRAVVDFMIHYYDAPALVDIARGIYAEACCAPQGQLQDCFVVLEHIYKQAPDPTARRELIRALDSDVLCRPDTPQPLRDLHKDLQFDSPELWMPVPRAKGHRRRIIDEAWAAACGALVGPLGERDHAKINSAIKSLEGALANHKKEYQLFGLLGECYVELDQLEKARACFVDALRIEPENVWLRAHLARLESIAGNLTESEDLLRGVLQEDDRYLWAWRVLSGVLRAKRDDKAIEDVLRSMLKVDAANHGTWARLGEILHHNLKRYTEAEEIYRRAISINPKDALVWGLLGQLLGEEFKRYSEAEEAYKKAILLDSSNHWMWHHFGFLLFHGLKRHQEAEEAYRKSLSIDPNCASGWAELGQLLSGPLKKFAEAEEAYRKAISINSEDAWAWAHLGELLHEKMKRHTEAGKAYRKAISLDQSYAWAWAQLARLLHWDLRRYPQAEEAYKKLISLNERDRWAWTHLGVLYETLESFAEAEGAYRKSISIDHNDAHAWQHLGSLLHRRLKRYPEAEESYRKALSVEPTNATVWRALAELLHHCIHRYSAAEEAYHQAIANAKARPLSAVRSELGILHLDMEESEQAQRDFTTAIQEWFSGLSRGQTARGNRESLAVVGDLAVAGYLPSLLERLTESGLSEKMEPLVVAIKLLMGEKPRVAAEILEVAKDVAHDILAAVAIRRKEGHSWQFAALASVK